MKLEIEEKTNYLGETIYIVWISNEDGIFLPTCVARFESLEEAEKCFEDTLNKYRQPKSKIIKTIQI